MATGAFPHRPLQPCIPAKSARPASTHCFAPSLPHLSQRTNLSHYTLNLAPAILIIQQAHYTIFNLRNEDSNQTFLDMSSHPYPLTLRSKNLVVSLLSFSQISDRTILSKRACHTGLLQQARTTHSLIFVTEFHSALYGRESAFPNNHESQGLRESHRIYR